MQPLVIGISGINTTDNPGPGVALARSFKESRLKTTCIGLGYDPNEPGHYLRWAIDRSYLLPYPSRGWKEMQARLAAIRLETGMEVLIPCLDAELPLYLKYRDELAKLGLKTLLPTEEQFELRSKDNLDVLAADIGCSYPGTTLASSVDEVYRILFENPEFPTVIKGKYYKAYKVYNINTAVEKATEIAAEWGFPILIQKYVEGQDINLIGLGDGKGNLCGCVSIKKQTKTDLGKVWTAITIYDEGLVELAKRFCASTKWQGPFELEAMRSGSEINLIEINPRFPAWVYFATAVGVNLAERMIDLLYEGECDRSLQYPVGKHLIRYTHECLGDWDSFHDLITLGGTGASL
jgi:carbamoyl-phosphate synthase large subunit